MAITKVNKGADRLDIAFDVNGNIAAVKARVRVVVVENGADSTLGNITEVDLWPQLTVQQQSSLQAISTRLLSLASTLDVALPTMPVPIAAVHP